MTHGHFRNRVPIQDVRRVRRSAAGQESKVLEFFESRPDGLHTPHAVLAALKLEGKISDQTPITSIRRAITDLTKEGKLEKVVDHQRLEIYGVCNCCWRLVKRSAQLELI